MSHDKKKSKKVVAGTQVPVEAVSVTAKGSANNDQKGSGDGKGGARNAVPDTKNASKSKKR